MRFIIVIFAVFFTACSTLPIPAPTAKEWPVEGWQPEYTQFIRDKTPEFLLADEPAGYEPSSWCPKYHGLSREQRKEFWAKFWFNVTEPESGFNRTSQYVETTMDTDPVTGVQVKSEGLLQLSYQDAKSYPSCPTCQKFNWESDKSKPLKDRTIMDPLLNLGCGIEIAEWTLKHYKSTPFQSALGEYWATVRDDDVEVPEICK